MSDRESRFKFRVWDKLLNKFVPWNAFIPFDSKEYVVQQFTGLRDKNGQEIYEGDIVKSDPKHITNVLKSDRMGTYTNGTITWLREGYCVCQYYTGATDLHEFAMCGCCPCGLEIIGNELENPELCSTLN